MRVVRDGLWLCTDCLLLQETGDTSSFDYHYGQAEGDARVEECQQGLTRLELSNGGHLAANWDSETGEGIHEFSSCYCDACGTHLAGKRHRYSIIGN